MSGKKKKKQPTQEAKSQTSKESAREDFRATDAPPGTDEKIDIMMNRASQRQPLFHPQDNRGNSDKPPGAAFLEALVEQEAASRKKELLDDAREEARRSRSKSADQIRREIEREIKREADCG